MLYEGEWFEGAYGFLTHLRDHPWSLWSRTLEPDFHHVLFLSDRDVHRMKVDLQERKALEKGEKWARCCDASDYRDGKDTICGLSGVYTTLLDVDRLVEFTTNLIESSAGTDIFTDDSIHVILRLPDSETLVH